ncbi:hypothetical protein OL358_05645 [Microbacterium sp. SSM24]|nr:hypothetical protein [Microbacterium sp. SSM24]MCW3492835.1 hypothetical protein [Microbacterium sp. SSM24]
MSRTMPVASRTTHSADAARNRLLKPGIPRLVATIASSDRPSPAAAISCMTVLTGMGMRPTTVRCRPADTTDTRKARAVRRPVVVGSTVTARTPYVASRKPDTIAVPLKTCPDRSSKLPSREKCNCHHSGSRVVRIAMITPAASAAIAPWLK